MSDIGDQDAAVSRDRMERMRKALAKMSSKDKAFAAIAKDIVDNARDRDPVDMACALPHATNRFFSGLGFTESMSPSFVMANLAMVLGFLGEPMPGALDQWDSNYDAGEAIRAAVDKMLETTS